ncbi:hypothetical protein [Dishui Lake large algae virus 1]|nr:hypothetical protein [Dishui Lake large algae virus 1]
MRHLARVVSDIPFSKKLWSQRHYPKERYGKPLDYEKDKEEFFKRLKKYDIDNIIALDETNIQLGMSRKKARCYVGKRCIKQTDNNDIFQRFSLLVAISPDKIQGWMLKKGAVRSEDLKPFVQTLLQNRTPKRLLIMDNAPSHKKGIDKEVANMGHELLYILPYTHYLNPIENFFNQLKHYMRDKTPMNEEDVRKAIEYSASKVSKTDLRNYFLNAYNPEKLDKKREPKRREPKKKYKKTPI